MGRVIAVTRIGVPSNPRVNALTGQRVPKWNSLNEFKPKVGC